MSNNQAPDGQSPQGTPWVYSDEVREHFFNPKNFTSKSPKDYNGLGMVGSPACLNSSTLIISNQSFKAISSLNRRDKVLSHDSNYYPVEKVFCSKYSGNVLIKIKNCLGELTATPDHLVYAKQIPSRTTYGHNFYKRKMISSWIHAGDLRKKDIILYPIPDKISNNIKFI